MKRALLSIAISVALLIVYAMFSSIVVLLLSRDPQHLDPQVVAAVDIPLRAPKYVYYYFFPPTAADYSMNVQNFGPGRIILAATFFVINALLYAIPVFFILTLIARSRSRAKQKHQITSPPEPPSFRDE